VTAIVRNYPNGLQLYSGNSAISTALQTILSNAGFPTPTQVANSGNNTFLVYQLSNNSGTFSTVFLVITIFVPVYVGNRNNISASNNVSNASISFNLFNTWNTGTFAGTGSLSTQTYLVTGGDCFGANAFHNVTTYNDNEGSYSLIVLTNPNNLFRLLFGFAKTVNNYVSNPETFGPSVHLLYTTNLNTFNSYGTTNAYGSSTTSSNLQTYVHGVSGTSVWTPPNLDLDFNYQLIKPVNLRTGSFAIGGLSSDFIGCNVPTSGIIHGFTYSDLLTVSASEVYTYLTNGIAIRTT